MKTQFKLAKISVVGAAVGLASAFSLSAQTQMNTTSKWYVGGDAGLCLQQNVGGVTQEDLQTHTTYNNLPDAKFDPGVRADLSVGYNLTENWAVELESGFSYNELSQIGQAKDAGYKLYQVPILLNGIYKYSFNDKWQAYGGLGLGGVAGIFDLSSNGSGRDTDFQFGYQAELGVKYHITANWECDLGYKFLGTTDHKWTLVSNAGGHYRIQMDSTMSHSILLSLTYKF